jgi:phosphate transport system protein
VTETRRLFHEELDEINTDVIRLGVMGSEAIEAATGALLDGDLSAVEEVVAHDRDLDDLTHSIEDRTYLLLARQQPMAVDLRTLVTVLRVIHELERVGDLMVNVAKAARRLYPHALEPKVRGIIDRMREQAGVQVRLAVDTFAARDPARASALVDMDDVMDDLQKDLFRVIFASQGNDEATIQRAVQIALVGRYFERVADHAVNVAERVAYMVTGEFTNRSEP